MPVNLEKPGKKPPASPDLSIKYRNEWSVRDRTIAIMILAAFVAVIALGIGAFSVRDNSRVEAALADLENQKETQIKEYGQKLAELTEREQALAVRETKVTAREEAVAQGEAELKTAQALLASDRADLTAEEEAFYDQQSRVRELSEALYLELTPDE